jgi:hypothetical protein
MRVVAIQQALKEREFLDVRREMASSGSSRFLSP